MYLAACLAVASSFSIVLSALITPIMLLLTGGLLKLALKLGIAEAPARAGIAAIHDFAVRSASALQIPIGHYDVVAGSSVSVTLLQIIAPPLLAGALVWWGLHGLFLRASGIDVIRHFGARPARVDDALERRLVDVVKDVAVGSDTPAPKPFIIDSPTINATALGHTPNHAVLLVTRGLLEQLDQDETEAIIARLVTGLAAGDINIASGIMATFHTFFFFLTVLDLPFRLSAWRTLGRLALLMVTPRPGTKAISHISASLENSAQINNFALHKAAMFFWSPFILCAPMRLLWHNRCFSGDAQTAKLTHTPHAFACALHKIGPVEPLPGTETYAWLFIGTPTFGEGDFADHQRMIEVLPPELMDRAHRLTTRRADLPPRPPVKWKTSRSNWKWPSMTANPGKIVAANVRLGGITFLWGAALILSAIFAMEFGLALGLPLVVHLI